MAEVAEVSCSCSDDTCDDSSRSSEEASAAAAADGAGEEKASGGGRAGLRTREGEEEGLSLASTCSFSPSMAPCCCRTIALLCWYRNCSCWHCDASSLMPAAWEAFHSSVLSASEVSEERSSSTT